MERFAISLNAGKPTRRTLSGREYLVAPATLIVPGVLSGSQGPLYYPPDEVARDPWAWNGMPIVGYHPQVNGMHVSGRDPDILETQGLGHVYRAKAGDRLNAELWFDVQATRNFDTKLQSQHQILPRLEAGKPIEISTGLFTDNHPAEAGATHNGKAYSFIARNYRPDHLAVLPDQVGACSVADGCGINVNANDAQPLFTLADNAEKCPKCDGEMTDGACACEPTDNANPEGCNQYKECGSVSELHESADKMSAADARANAEKLVAGKSKEELAVALKSMGFTPSGNAKKMAAQIVQQIAELAATGEQTRSIDAMFKNNSTGDSPMASREQNITFLTANCDCWKGKEKVLANKDAFTDADLEKLKANHDKMTTLIANAAPPPPKPKPDDEEEEDEEKEEEKKMAKNQAQKPVTTNEWLASAPAEIQAAVRNAMVVEKRERQRIIGLLVANLEESRRDAVAQKLSTKTLEDLQERLELLPTTNAQPQEPLYILPGNFQGAAGGPIGVGGKNVKKKPLPKFAINWDEVASSQQRQPV